ncbi:MAG: hypothetical protein FD180_470 [Planctomycetota bacterium]|nr:MAG: hypothetical protein FD180_470 [Planctomycetota bacterium]
MIRFVAFSAVLLTAGMLLTWSPATAAPPAAYSFQELEKMETESVASALAWLARHQEADGSWKASGGAGHGFEALYEADAAKSCDVMATASALFAFMGDGNSLWMGRYQEAVKRGWNWLVQQQKATKTGCMVPLAEEAAGGSLSEREKAAKRAHMARMNHLWGTVALLEAVRSAEFDERLVPVRDEAKLKRHNEVLKPAELAVKWITDDPATKPDKFDFLNPKTVNMDELALLAAVRYVFGKQGVTGDKEFFAGVTESITKIQEGMTEALVPYRYSEDGEYWFGGSISTPQCMIAFVYTYNGGSAKQMAAASPALLAHPPAWNPYYEIGRPSRHPEAGAGGGMKAAPASLPDGLKDVAGSWRDDIANEASWFWQGMAFRSYAAIGSGEWDKWRASFTPLAREHQRRSGPEAGSWDPVGPHARVFGREIATAWMAVTMQSRCRLQISQSDWKYLKEDPRWRARKENLEGAPVLAVKCLVCDMGILSNTPFSKGEGDKIYYFCSQEHQDQFEMNPSAWKDGKKPDPNGEGSEGSHK